MNPREKKLLILIGAIVGIFVVYSGVKYVFLNPIAEANDKIAKFTTETNRLKGVIRSRENLARRWRDLVARTYSYDSAEALNRFGQELKAIAKNRTITVTSVAPAGGMKIGSRSGIEAVGYRFTLEGRFSEMLACVLDLYRTKNLCQISKIAWSPILQKGRGRDEVKMELTIETPVPPKIDKKAIPEAADVATLPMEVDPAMAPARPNTKSADDLPLLADRLIFRPYVPPPTNAIIVDNQDWKTVALRVAFLWDGKLNEEVVDTLPSKTQRTYTKKGDVVVIKGAYADGKAFGPEQFDFNTKKDFTYLVAVHSPAPPPEVVDLAVDNKDKDAVDIEIVVTPKEGAAKTKPTIRVKGANKEDLEAYPCKSLQITATYASGKKAASATFSPSTSKQTYTVPVEPVESVAEVPKPVNDPPADAGAVVTGLVTYEGTQEMIANASGTRKVIRAGEPATVDGGILLAVHPLGGVVKMPSGNFYLYPLGKKFTDRVKLEAQEEQELATAIDAWTKQ